MRKMKEKISLKRIKHSIIWRWTNWRWTLLHKLLFRLVPVFKKRICVISWGGKYFNCNPKAIATYIATNNYNHLQVIAVVNNPKEYKATYPNIKFVKTKSIGHIIAQLTCKVFIANIRMTDFQKRPGQIYIQTWHGMGPKKSEKDSLKSLAEEYIQDAVKDCNQTDIMLSGSRWQTDWIKNSTWYKGKVLEIGTPRDDCFFNKEEHRENKSRVYVTYGIDFSTKIILYAPTFRSLGEIAQNSIDIETLLATFSEKFGSEFVLLLRLHPNVANKPLPETYAKHLSTKVFNATTYPDMQDLLCASDVLITDFSSVSTEFVMQDKPCFLYIPDYKTYDRGLYFQPEDMPFPYSFDNKQLIECIQMFNKESYYKKANAYKALIGLKENGRACENLAEYLKRVSTDTEYL